MNTVKYFKIEQINTEYGIADWKMTWENLSPLEVLGLLEIAKHRTIAQTEEKIKERKQSITLNKEP